MPPTPSSLAQALGDHYRLEREPGRLGMATGYHAAFAEDGIWAVARAWSPEDRRSMRAQIQSTDLRVPRTP